MARELMDIEVARAAVLQRCAALDAEEGPIDGALGRVLSTDISSAHAIPPFDNSAMDGYAVRAADTRNAAPDSPAVLEVVDESRAGAPAEASLGAGKAIAISTGAPMPAGADAIVRLEDTGQRDGSIAVTSPVEPGRDLRHAG